MVARLPKTSVIKVIKEGRVVHSPLFTIKLIKNNLSVSRLSVVVSKKEIKKAVSRNKIKRIFREILRKVLKNKDFFYGDIVCFVKKEAESAKFQTILNEIETVFEKKF